MIDEDPKLDLTPMIDCVFLLLIFFMCMKFKSYENKVESHLPKDQGIAPTTPIPVSQLRIAIVYDAATGAVELQPTPRIGPFSIISQSANRQEMFDRLVAQIREGYPYVGDKIEISPDAEVPFDYVALTVDAVHKAQADVPADDRKPITFQAAPPSGR